MTHAKVAIAGLAIWMGLAAVAGAEDRTVVTDSQIKKMFERSREARGLHDVMADQRERLRTILDGFIMGDVKIIYKAADEFDDDMHLVSQKVKFGRESEAEVWESLSLIVKLAKKMKDNLDKKDYHKAFVDYSAITSQCVRCHEAVRDWGKLESRPEEAAQPEESGKKSPSQKKDIPEPPKKFGEAEASKESAS